MICPNCHSQIPDGSVECPVCSSQPGLTQVINLQDINWCPNCGALVPAGAKVCPKCLTMVDAGDDEPQQRSIRDLKLPSVVDVNATSQIGVPTVPSLDALQEREAARPAADEPSIESAIPAAGPDAPSASMRHDKMPKIKDLAFAGVFAVLVVSALALIVTHPWDPNNTSSRATTPIDTSTAGSPGNVESLSGQDGVKATSAADTLYSTIETDYNRLGELANQVNNNEASLFSIGISSDLSARQQGQSDLYAISIEVSNLISSLSGLDSGAGAYSETLSNLTTLGNWLRNRCDSLTEAWALSVASSDPAADASSIEYPVTKTYETSTKSSYQVLFEENYENWKPVKSE